MTMRLMVGAVLYADDDTILLSDRTLFAAPAGRRLPHYSAGTTIVIEYEVVADRNMLVAVPQIRV